MNLQPFKTKQSFIDEEALCLSSLRMFIGLYTGLWVEHYKKVLK